MKCPICGKESEGNFCQFCGAKFSNRPADRKGVDERTVHIGPASGNPGGSSPDRTVKGQERMQNDRPGSNGAQRGGSAYGGPGSLGGNRQNDRRPGVPVSSGPPSGSSGRPDRNTIYVGIMVTITAVLVVLFIALAMAVFNKDKDSETSDTAVTSQEESDTGVSAVPDTQPAEDSDTDTSKNSDKDSGKDSDQDADGNTTTQPVQPTPSGDQTSESDDKQTYPKPEKMPENKFSYNGHTYGFYNAGNLDSYDEVEDFCERQGGHLAVIDDPNENDKLFSELTKHYDSTAFFGYSDIQQEGRWVWAYGSSDYVNWTNNAKEHQPDNGSGYDGDEDVAEFNYDGTKDDIINDGTWNDAPFRQNTSIFICEWEYDWINN